MFDIPAAGSASLPGNVSLTANETSLPDTYCDCRAHFLYGAGSLVEVRTDDGVWIAPPRCGVWIPAGTRYRMRTPLGRSVSVHVDPSDAPRNARRCEVLGVTSLLHELLSVSNNPGACVDGGRNGLILCLILMEIQRAPVHAYHVGLPCDVRLSILCQSFLQRPSIRCTAGRWAAELRMSESAFNRLFKRETGLAFGAWRQQACVLAALSMLSPHVAVARVSLELGYESPGSFTIMFRKALGKSPSSFVVQSYGTRD